MYSPSDAPFALLGCDARGVVAWSSGSVTELCGRAPATLAGRPLAAVLPGVGAAARTRVAKAFASGAPFRLELGALRLEGAPGAGSGAPDWCVALRPVSQSAAALAESEDRYRRLVDACPEPILVHADGKLRFVNAAGLALLGVDAADAVLGRSMMDFVHPADRPLVAERVRKMLETGGRTLLLEQRIVRPDGSVREVELAGAAVVLQGERAIQLVGRDVTEQRRTEAERRRLEEQVREARRRESLLRLAEGVADRLSRLSAELLDRADACLAHPSRRERLDPGPIRQVGLDMARLTEQLLGYVGRRRADVAAVNLSALVLELSEDLEAELEPHTTLSLDLPMGLPAVQVNTGQMRRVVHVLLRNALDALGDRGGRVALRTRVVELDAQALASLQPPAALQPGRYVALELRDDGCGMDAATSERVYDPFFSTKSPERGLGLAEVTGLVGAQGGGLRVESAPGRGTTVQLVFPALPASRPLALAPVRAVARRPERRRRRGR